MYLNNIYFNIAEFIIRIYTNENALIYIPDGYEPFIEKENKQVDVEIEVLQGLPYDVKNGLEVFCAYDDNTSENTGKGNILWHILSYGGDELVFTSEPTQKIYPYLAARFCDNTKQWVIYNSELIEYNGNKLLNPLAYPMGPLLLYHLGLYNKSVMIHASGVDSFKEGYLFSGFSGVGKSTMAGLWQNKSYSIINDDRLMIRKLDGKYYIFNTPMPYKDIPKKAPLDACFLLKQHPDNYLTKLDKLTAMTRLMAFCIQHHYRKEHITLMMEIVADITSETTLYELGFIPDESVIELILNEREKYKLK